MRYAICFALFAAKAAACPPAPDHEAAKDEIFRQLQLSQSEGEAQGMSVLLWEYWLDAPDEVAQDLLDRGMAARNAFDYAGSLSILSELVAYCPEYAEGYNQRAFSAFLAQDFTSALADLEQAQALDGRHLGVLTGKALTLMSMARDDEAQEVLRQALRLNPWLGERHLLRGPPEVEL